MEIVVHCRVCDFDEAWTTELAAMAAGVWHVFDNHRDEWLRIAGDRAAPYDLRPDELGRRFEDWERQTHPRRVIRVGLN